MDVGLMIIFIGVFALICVILYPIVNALTRFFSNDNGREQKKNSERIIKQNEKIINLLEEIKEQTK